jgi:uncharacterized protein
MYGRSFEDQDGHVWELMWMDMEANKEQWEKEKEAKAKAAQGGA